MRSKGYANLFLRFFLHPFSLSSILSPMNTPPVRPRRDLREPAFRRYEALISKACGGSFIHRPQGQSAATFIARFYDARLAFRRYHYKSYQILSSYPLERIKLFELEDGRVFIQNLYEDGQTQQREATIYHASDQAAVLELARKLGCKELVGEYKVVVQNAEEAAFMATLSDKFDVATQDQEDGTFKII